MGFSPKQRRALARDVKSCFVRTRQLPEGRELSYIEGWHAVSEANRIFGFDGWNRETVESRCVVGREARGQFQAVYIAKVRVTVRANEHLIVREGYGTGEALAVTLGEAHERAIKTAETDATKRALATFGKPFGLALYGGSKGQLPQSQPRRPEIVRRRTAQTLSRSGRYQVAPRPMPNPSHATTMLAQLDHAESGGPSDATAGESVALNHYRWPAIQPRNRSTTNHSRSTTGC